MKPLVKNFNQFLNESYGGHDNYSSCCGAPVEEDGTCARCGERCEPAEEGGLSAHDRMYNSDDWVRAQRDAEGLD
jgi:hypothetical protein